MSTTIYSETEQLTLELPSWIMSALRAEAEAEGRDVSSIAADRFTNLYAVATNGSLSPSPSIDPDVAYAALHGPAKRFDPKAISKKYQEKYGVPDLSHLSKEELATKAEEIIDQIEPAKRAEMERLGLL